MSFKQQIILVTVGTENWDPTDPQLAEIEEKFKPVRDAGHIVIVLRDGVRMQVVDPEAVGVTATVTTAEQAADALAALAGADPTAFRPITEADFPQDLSCGCGEHHSTPAEEELEVYEVKDIVGGAALDEYLDDVKRTVEDLLAPNESLDITISVSLDRGGKSVNSWHSHALIDSTQKSRPGVDKPATSL